jgi:hypothetical protein
MPDTTQSTALRQLRTFFTPGVYERLTISLRQAPQDIADKIDIVLVVDMSSSAQSKLEDLEDLLGGLPAALDAQYPKRRWAVVSFSDIPTLVADLGSFALAEAAISGLVGHPAAGDGDTPQDGYGALHMAARLDFRDDAARAIILVTDATSHTRNKSFYSAKSAMQINKVHLFSGINHDDATGYDLLVEDTGGAKLTVATAAHFAAALDALANPIADPIHLVNDNMPLTALIETGTEVTFVTRSFELNPFVSGEDGSPSIQLTIDNTDFAVSRYINNARKFAVPLEVVLRIYMTNDLTGPQNNPPMVLFATDFDTRGSVVGCKLSWIDLINSKFPNFYYTPARCPSLQQ